MKKYKVLLLTNMFTPYWVPLLNRVSSLAHERGWSFKAVALSRKETNRDWEVYRENFRFDYQVLEGRQLILNRRGFPVHINRGIYKLLREYGPDAVITSGYDSPAYWQAFTYCKLFRRKFILRNGTTLLSANTLGGVKGFLKRAIVRGSDGYIAYGTKAKEYLQYLGAGEKPVTVSFNTVDMDYFRDKAAGFRAGEGFIKKRGKYPELLLMYTGRLFGSKGVLQVLEALSALNDPEVGLMVVGSGPQEGELKNFCKENKLQSVFFEGFRQQDELPEYYALADAFVLPTFDEVWGLVVNEALAAGQYALCSRYAGAGYDLIRAGFNGELFDPGDVGGLAGTIRRLKEGLPDIRERRGEISRHAVSEYGIEKSAPGFIEAASLALGAA